MISKDLVLYQIDPSPRLRSLQLILLFLLLFFYFFFFFAICWWMVYGGGDGVGVVGRGTRAAYGQRGSDALNSHLGAVRWFNSRGAALVTRLILVHWPAHCQFVAGRCSLRVINPPGGFWGLTTAAPTPHTP